MNKDIVREISPLTKNDCLTVCSRVTKESCYYLHYHDEFELHFIRNGAGAKRIVGDHIEVIGDIDLVLIGPDLYHSWFTPLCKKDEIFELTIQWHRDLFEENFLGRNQLKCIRSMFERASRGICFSAETSKSLTPRLLAMKEKTGFEAVLELMSILHELSISPNAQTLSNSVFTNERCSYDSRRIEKAFQYMHHNYDKSVTLGEVAKLVNMTEVSFSRFIKKRTGNTFIDSLNEIRLGHASKKLIDTTHSISEISYHCGFNNISNFNRIFKKKKGCTPKEFRESFMIGSKIYV